MDAMFRGHRSVWSAVARAGIGLVCIGGSVVAGCDSKAATAVGQRPARRVLGQPPWSLAPTLVSSPSADGEDLGLALGSITQHTRFRLLNAESDPQSAEEREMAIRAAHRLSKCGPAAAAEPWKATSTVFSYLLNDARTLSGHLREAGIAAAGEGNKADAQACMRSCFLLGYYLYLIIPMESRATPYGCATILNHAFDIALSIQENAEDRGALSVLIRDLKADTDDQEMEYARMRPK